MSELYPQHEQNEADAEFRHMMCYTFSALEAHSFEKSLRLMDQGRERSAKMLAAADWGFEWTDDDAPFRRARRAFDNEWTPED